MSQRETELRRRLAGDNVDIVEIMTWFLDAIDAKTYADGKPGEPDLSWFEREFLRDNAERYHQERLKRMSVIDLVVHVVLAEPEPGQNDVDMREVPDRDLVNALVGDHSNSASAELLKRANAKRVTVADWLREVTAPDTR
jgi:hypothetical protein